MGSSYESNPPILEEVGTIAKDMKNKVFSFTWLRVRCVNITPNQMLQKRKNVL